MTLLYNISKKNTTRKGKKWKKISEVGMINVGAYNTYDVAGNIWEKTEEHVSSGGYAGNSLLRGGGCVDNADIYPVCYHFGYHDAKIMYIHVGFRVVLYLQ